MMTANRRVGRLVEIYCESPVDVGQAKALAASLRYIAQGAGTEIVTCADIRRVRVFPPDVSELLIDLMRSTNGTSIRSAFVFEPSSIFGMQMDRMVREARNPDRHCFTSKDAALLWLSDVLKPAERRRLEQFLDEPSMKLTG